MPVNKNLIKKRRILSSDLYRLAVGSGFGLDFSTRPRPNAGSGFGVKGRPRVEL